MRWTGRGEGDEEQVSMCCGGASPTVSEAADLESVVSRPESQSQLHPAPWWGPHWVPSPIRPWFTPL